MTFSTSIAQQLQTKAADSFNICSSFKKYFCCRIFLFTILDIYWHERGEAFPDIGNRYEHPLQRVLQSKSWREFFQRRMREKEIFAILLEYTDNMKKYKVKNCMCWRTTYQGSQASMDCSILVIFRCVSTSSTYPSEFVSQSLSQ